MRGISKAGVSRHLNRVPVTPWSTRRPPRPAAAYKFLDLPQGEVHNLSGRGLSVFIHYKRPVRKYSLSHNIFAVYTFVDH